MRNIRKILAASLAAFLVSACSDQSNPTTEIEIQTLENKVNEHEDLYNSIIRIDNTIPIIEGKYFTLTNQDLYNRIFADNVLAGEALYKEIFAFLLKNSFPNTDSEINAFLAEQASYSMQNNDFTTSYLEDDISTYLSLLKAAEKHLPITDEEKENFYNKYYDKEIYKNIEDIPNLDEEILFQKMSNPSQINDIFKFLLTENETDISFPENNQTIIDFEKVLSQSVNNNSSRSLLISKTQLKTLNKDENANFLIISLNNNKLFWSDIKKKMFLNELPNALFEFIAFNSIIHKEEPDINTAENLLDIWSEKYSDFNKENNSNVIYANFITSLYQRELSNKDEFILVLQNFHNNNLKGSSKDDYFYKDTSFEKIPKVDLAYEFFLNQKDVYMNPVILEKEMVFGGFLYYDDKILSFIEKKTKNIE